MKALRLVAAAVSPQRTPMKFIDIGANLTDEVYSGIYNGKRYHAADLESVLERARRSGLDKVIVTAGTLQMSSDALQLAQTDETVGVHPTRCGEFQGREDVHLRSLLDIAQQGKNKVVAIGECGLDYDRLQFCDKDTQMKYFESQFWLAEQTKLPMFLHMRAACADFIDILKRNLDKFHGGVVHSFTGTPEEARQLLAFDNLYIGINGCSLKTEDNLRSLLEIPIERMMIETDCPYCDIRNTHASKRYVDTDNLFKSVDKKKHDGVSLIKGRNEPCTVRQVLDVVAGVKGGNKEELAEVLYNNTVSLFFND